MSLRNRIVLPVILSAAGVLAGCGGNGASITRPTAPASGSFSQSNLNGTYVFSSSGTDTNGAPYAIVGTFTANGSGGISGGVLDMNDAAFGTSSPAIAPVANAAISGGSYSLGVDGRGKISLNTGNNTPFTSPIILDYVLQDSGHGLVTEFDGNASGSGSLDLQASGVTPTGSYAFIFSGAYNSTGAANGVSFATVGNFTLAGAAMSGLEDINSSGISVADTLSGTFSLGPATTPATQIVATGSTNYSITYDVFAVDATHLKFIEMDANGTLSGDAFAQTSPTIPTGTLAFTLIGGTSSVVTAAGGFMVTDGSGSIVNTSTEDINSSSGTVSTSPVGFSGTYAGAAGRYVVGPLAGFVGATEFVAYPSSGGLLLLESDSSGGILAGAAYAQSSTVVPDVSQGYALNLSGTNLGASTGQAAEVDDIAEFATASSGLNLTGITDENFAPGSQPIYALALNGSYTAPASGRGQVSANAGNSNNSTLNGGFIVNYYTVDGTTFPFIEVDNGQIAAGVFVKQSSSSSSSAATRAHMYVLPPVVRPHALLRKQK